jgi:riboflavin biosynthesis pyrimidine reductase
VVLAISEWPSGTRPVFVLSRRALPTAPAGAVEERMNAPPAEVYAQLQARGFRHVYVDGGLTAQSFLRAGLVDSLTITRVPVLIGAGIPLFGALDADLPLTLVATRQLASGAVQSEYRVIRAP